MGRVGQLGAILCKLFRLEVYIKEGGGGPKSRKHANVVYERPLKATVYSAASKIDTVAWMP